MRRNRTLASAPKTARLILCAIVLAASGCAQTQYVDLESDFGNKPSLTRDVGVKISPSFADNAQECVIIMKPEATPDMRAYGKILEGALGRQLSSKFSKIIGSSERNHIARRNALDLNFSSDQRALAEISDCDALLYSRLTGPGETYLVVWSQFKVGLQLSVKSAKTQKVLFQAEHLAERSGGGVPFSPLGVVVDAYSSVQLSSDKETAVSVIEDAIRRMVQIMPNK